MDVKFDKFWNYFFKVKILPVKERLLAGGENPQTLEHQINIVKTALRHRHDLSENEKIEYEKLKNERQKIIKLISFICR